MPDSKVIVRQKIRITYTIIPQPKFMQGIQQAPYNTNPKTTINYIFNFSFRIKKSFLQSHELGIKSIGGIQYYIITQCPKFETPRPLFALDQFWQHPAYPISGMFKTQPNPSPHHPHYHLSQKQYICVITPYKNYKKCFLNVTQVHQDTNGINYKG